MAEFRDVAKAYKRLCDAFGSCTDCPLNDLTKKTFCACESSVAKFYPEEAERIIMKWAKENPLMTNGRKFREVFGEDMMVMLTEEHAPLGDWLTAEYKGGQDG